MTRQCESCNDTGSLSKSLYGGLDCGCCGVAIERMELARWITTQRDDPHVLAWRIHLRAKDELDEPARAPVLPLFQPGRIGR